MAATRLITILSTLPLIQRLTLLTTTPLLLYIVRLVYTDYRAWLALGSGGVPHNLFGYAVQTCLRVFGKSDTRSLGPYMSVPLVSVYHRSHNATYLAPLPTRTGNPPSVPAYVAPQRQTDQTPGQGVRDASITAFNALAARNPDLITAAPSKLEGGRGPAYFLPSTARQPAFTHPTRGEIAHVHAHAEGSAHVLLTPRDAKEVLVKGWGERHLLSGVGASIGYTMVYAPRDEGEVDTFMRIVTAAVRAATLGAEVE